MRCKSPRSDRDDRTNACEAKRAARELTLERQSAGRAPARDLGQAPLPRRRRGRMRTERWPANRRRAHTASHQARRFPSLIPFLAHSAPSSTLESRLGGCHRGHRNEASGAFQEHDTTTGLPCTRPIHPADALPVVLSSRWNDTITRCLATGDAKTHALGMRRA